MEPLTGPTEKADSTVRPAKPWVSVIIPALNEEETIGDVVRASIRVSAIPHALLLLKFPGLLERCHRRVRPDIMLQERLGRHN